MEGNKDSHWLIFLCLMSYALCTLKYNNTGTSATLWISVIRERASKVVSLAFSKLYYACAVNDSGDRTVS